MTDPKIVDAELAELYKQEDRLEHAIRSATEIFHRVVGDRQTYVTRTRKVWNLSDEEAEERAANGVGVAPYDVSRVAETFARRTAAEEALLVVRTRQAELNAIYRQAPWSRFFIVDGGHIHSSRACHTCRPTTQFGWLPELSGETEKQAVEAHGALLCTVCFPTAPVEWTNHYEVKAAEKAAAACPGSGQTYNPNKPHQLRQMSKWGYCRECDTVQTVTSASTGKIRTHKKGAQRS